MTVLTTKRVEELSEYYWEYGFKGSDQNSLFEDIRDTLEELQQLREYKDRVIDQVHEIRFYDL